MSQSRFCAFEIHKETIRKTVGLEARIIRKGRGLRETDDKQ